MKIKIELGDGIFYSIISLIIMILVWLKFIEKYLPLWWAVIAWVCLVSFICYAVINNYKK